MVSIPLSLSNKLLAPSPRAVLSLSSRLELAAASLPEEAEGNEHESGEQAQEQEGSVGLELGAMRAPAGVVADPHGQALGSHSQPNTSTRAKSP